VVSKRRRLLRANRNPCHIKVNELAAIAGPRKLHCASDIYGSWRAARLPDDGFVLPLLNSSLCGARMRTSRHIESCLKSQ